MANPAPKTEHLISTQFKPAGDRRLHGKLTSIRFYADQIEALWLLDGTLSENIRRYIDEGLQRDGLL